MNKNINETLSNRQQRHKKYRETIKQIKQNYMFNQSRYQSKPQSHTTVSPRISNNETRTTRNHNYQSSFLPSINSSRKKQPISIQHHRNLSYASEASRVFDHDTDIQTIQALAECDIIIQNLRRLRLKSLSSMKKKQFEQRTKMENSHIPYSKNLERGNMGKQKEPKAQQEVMMFRAWEPDQGHKIFKNKKKQLKIKVSDRMHMVGQDPEKQEMEQMEHMEEKEEKQYDEEEVQEENQQQYQDEDEDKEKSFSNDLIPQTMSISQVKDSGMHDFIDESIDVNIGVNEENGENGENGMNEQQDQEKKDRQKISKRQQFLLKYLGKAKMRGAQLHQKIINFRNKTITIPQKTEPSELSMRQNAEEFEEQVKIMEKQPEKKSKTLK